MMDYEEEGEITDGELNVDWDSVELRGLGFAFGLLFGWPLEVNTSCVLLFGSGDAGNHLLAHQRCTDPPNLLGAKTQISVMSSASKPAPKNGHAYVYTYTYPPSNPKLTTAAVYFMLPG